MEASSQHHHPNNLLNDVIVFHMEEASNHFTTQKVCAHTTIFGNGEVDKLAK